MSLRYCARSERVDRPLRAAASRCGGCTRRSSPSSRSSPSRSTRGCDPPATDFTPFPRQALLFARQRNLASGSCLGTRLGKRCQDSSSTAVVDESTGAQPGDPASPVPASVSVVSALCADHGVGRGDLGDQPAPVAPYANPFAEAAEELLVIDASAAADAGRARRRRVQSAQDGRRLDGDYARGRGGDAPGRHAVGVRPDQEQPAARLRAAGRLDLGAGAGVTCAA